ncbi:MAG: cyclophilin-like fold protein [Gemmataceae bacterium]
MAHPIRIKVGELDIPAELNDSETAKAILEALPLIGNANCWGNEIYFSISVRMEAGPDARFEMSVGELAYWPPGKAFCILFGPTPASSDDTPRMASESNPIGQVTGDATAFRTVKNGEEVVVEKG